MKRLAILGAGGHGRVVADAAAAAGCEFIVFYDDAWPSIDQPGPWAVAGTREDMLRAWTEGDRVVVAIGANERRLAMQLQLRVLGMALTSVVHPAAVVSSTATIGLGTVIFAGAIVNPFAIVGEGCIVNTAATVDHDCVLADGVHVGPGAHLGGRVSVGEGGWIGIGAAVRDGISIGDHSIIGAGAAVVRDVPPRSTVAGVPARPMKGRGNLS